MRLCHVVPAGQPADRRDDRRRRGLRRRLDPLLEAGNTPSWSASTTAAAGEPQASAPLAIGEVISPILAAKMGYGLPRRAACSGIDALEQRPPAGWSPEVVPADQSRWPGSSPELRARQLAASASSRPGLQRDFGLAAIALADAEGRTSRHRQAEGQGQDRQEEARAQGRAARGVPRPGDQAHRDARGRPLARPAAQLQGQHDARRPTSSTTPRSRGSRGWSAA